MRIIALVIALLPICGLAERLHIVIPAGPGGGLDTTSRALGQVLMQEGIVPRVSYENRSGGGGGKAMAYFVESGATLTDTLLMNSTPLLVRSLQGLFPHSYKDLTPIAGLMADPGVLAVSADSRFEDWQAVKHALQSESGNIVFGGGSVRGNLDHIVLSLLARAVGVDPRRVRYLPYDGGGKAMLALLGGEAEVLVSGLGETISQHEAGSVRILAIAGNARSDAVPEIPTFAELGTDVAFANWRGLFAPRESSEATVEALLEMTRSAVSSAGWAAQLERYGWQPQYLPGAEFAAYLEAQEVMLRSIMKDLGLLR